MLWLGDCQQPPLSFYKQFCDKYKDFQIRLICEDLTNPCAKYLIQNGLVKWKKQSIEEDIICLMNARFLTIAWGTFIFYHYF